MNGGDRAGFSGDEFADMDLTLPLREQQDLPPSAPPVPQPAPIRRLEQAVVNRIAAGEVIQRPASALKELLENSLDAGATTVNVTVKDGGLKLIQIADNGHGIRFEDLPLLCERHTTSKLRDFEDLQKINTLGFRGEALASMTFVAHLSVTTMTEGQTHGYKYEIVRGDFYGTHILKDSRIFRTSGSAISYCGKAYLTIIVILLFHWCRASYKDGVMMGNPRPCAALKGTLVTVENLFYNVVARKKAFKNPNEEYGRILDVISRYAIHKIGASFSCKKHGENRADVHTTASDSPVNAIRSVYGPSVARELIRMTVSDDDSSGATFQLTSWISSANYSAKKTTMVLFINDRLVECNALRKAIEVVYATMLPKASKPFLYLSITMPPSHVDVNVHPTKREVSFLNQESMVETIQKAVEGQLMQSNTTRTFYTQTLLPGAATLASKDEEESSPVTLGQRPPKKVPVNKLVRTDALNPAGRLHAYLQTKSGTDDKNDLAVTRKLVRQRRNPKESADLTSVQELLADIDQDTHSELTDIVKNCIYVGMADGTLALVQYKTCLYLLNIVNLSKELLYQQALRRFAHFDCVDLSSPTSLKDLFIMALNREGSWDESDGPKDQIAELNTELLKSKAEMLREYFGVEIDEKGNLCAIPIVLDQYSPDMDRVCDFVLSIGNNVDWEAEKECFETFAAAIADFYAIYPPLLPNPSDQGLKSWETSKPSTDSGVGTGSGNDGGSISEASSANVILDPDLLAEAKTVWSKRDWTIQHVFFPAMKLFLSPPRHMANDGTVVRVAYLENLYKVFERC
ncbi:unnamed protein product [Calypogeia fissa]